MPHDEGADNVSLVRELHRRQAEMYAGGPVDPVLELLASDVVWHVPGTSALAGDHRGHAGVASYFRTRTELAAATLELHPGGFLAEKDAVVQLVHGTARLGGELVRWRTVGVYRVAGGRIAEVWLVPLDLDQFDRAWRSVERNAR